MRALSKTAESKLIAAIEKAATLVNSGMSPNDAIVKSASEAEVPAGHIGLMVHAYNTGRTNKQREQGENTLEKAADFQLADINIVTEALYPKTVKTSAELTRETTVSTEYAVSPAGFLARRLAQQEKAAAAQVALPEKTWTPPPREAHEAVRRAYSQHHAEKRAAEELRRQATAAYTKAAASIDTLVEYFRVPGNMPYGDALREVELRFGQPGVSVLQKAAAVYPALTKQAATKADRFGHDSVYDLVNNVLENVHAYVAADSANPLKKAEAVCKKTAPNFLTGSILSGALNAPLELKSAAIETWHAAGSPPGPNKTPPALTAESYDSVTAPGQQWESDVERQIAQGERNKDQQAAGASQKQQLEAMRAIERQMAAQEKAERVKAEEDAAAAAAEEKTRYLWRSGLDKQKARQEAEEKAKAQAKADAEAVAYAKRVEADSAAAGKIPAPKTPFETLFGRRQPPKPGDEPPVDRGILGGAAHSAINAGSSALKSYPGVFKITDLPKNVAAPVSFVGKTMGMNGIGDALGLHTDPKALQAKSLKSLTAPEHETALRNIRAQGTLHDLVLNDPVISSYDPQEVAMAYNDLAEIAPNLVDAPGVLQSVLRKRLESGQLADFDVKQLLEMDKLRGERDMVQAQTRKLQQEAL